MNFEAVKEANASCSRNIFESNTRIYYPDWRCPKNSFLENEQISCGWLMRVHGSCGSRARVLFSDAIWLSDPRADCIFGADRFSGPLGDPLQNTYAENCSHGTWYGGRLSKAPSWGGLGVRFLLLCLAALVFHVACVGVEVLPMSDACGLYIFFVGVVF